MSGLIGGSGLLWAGQHFKTSAEEGTEGLGNDV